MQITIDTFENPEITCHITEGDDITILSDDGNLMNDINWSDISNNQREELCKTLSDLQRQLTTLGLT